MVWRRVFHPCEIMAVIIAYAFDSVHDGAAKNSVDLGEPLPLTPDPTEQEFS